MPPRATYRLQLGPDLSFADARRLVPYLRELGVSHLYLSPVLQARAGSTHGYDVVDPTRVSDELGGEAELRRLCAAGLGVIVDVVPNHMAASEDENPFWRDETVRRRFFDIDETTGSHRRFFDVDELAGVRVEDREVFETTHRLILELVAEGLVDGLRVDHIDGLAEPHAYLERLRSRGVQQVWVEKILQPGETLPDWPCCGTTGYEFANDVQALFVDAGSEETLTDLADDRGSFDEVAARAKLDLVLTTFQPEVDRLRRLIGVAGLEEALASLPVYRTYVEPRTGGISDADRTVAELLPPDVRRLILLEAAGADEFVTRFQQTTAAVMAKGVEDTAFYRYVRLLALNEVGGDPGRFGITVEQFHAANAARAERFPLALLAGTTHDTKRSADVRARIGALSHRAERFAEHARRWHELNAPLRRERGPDWTEELLIYQTLLGAWPIAPDRLGDYMRKALHEEKRFSSWTDPNERWDAAVADFCDGLYGNGAFLDDFEPFAAEVARAGEQASIGQLVLRLTSPGVPDIYNGDELWYLALVDPDNRRPFDHARGAAALERVLAGGSPTRATAKLFAIRALLALRSRNPEAFAGPYEPIEAPDGVCAFRRSEIVVAVPFREDAAPFTPPPGRWHSVLDGLGACLDGYQPLVLEPRRAATPSRARRKTRPGRSRA